MNLTYFTPLIFVTLISLTYPTDVLGKILMYFIAALPPLFLVMQPLVKKRSKIAESMIYWSTFLMFLFYGPLAIMTVLSEMLYKGANHEVVGWYLAFAFVFSFIPLILSISAFIVRMFHREDLAGK